MKQTKLSMIAAFLCLFTCSVTSVAQKSQSRDVEVLPDGIVMVDGLPFVSWQDYFQSDFFRTQGMRCGSTAPQLLANARLGGGQADCSSSSTNPDAIYDPSVVTYFIPVVVHVIQHAAGTGFLDAATVQSQIDILNEDFLALPSTNGSAGTDVQIQFFLATLDPSNNPTTGITYTTNTSWFNDTGTYYDSLAWDTNRYLNIYTNTANGYLGYASLAQSPFVGSNEDRVVILYSAFGRNSPFTPYDQGRTATHEVGHYLGLHHVFDGCGTPCSSSGDLICDTNQQSSPNFSCDNAGTCGQTDANTNYLDYTDDLCMTNFTSDQARRMRCSLEHWRPALWLLDPDCPSQPSPDCNDNCILDIDDITSGTEQDCNFNSIPDSCEFAGSYTEESGSQGPIGTSSSVTFVISSPPIASGDVTFDFRAVADIASRNQRLRLFLNNSLIGFAFLADSVVMCGNPPSLDTFVLSAASFNNLVNGGNATVRVDADGTIDPAACSGTSSLEFTISYDTSTAADTNLNGVPDACEYASGDNDLNGVVDVEDLLRLLGLWGPCGPPCPEDTNLDGVIDVEDLLNLLGGWG